MKTKHRYNKRKRLLVVVISLIVLIIIVWSVAAWNQGKNMRFVKKLGNGYNLGNSLDSTNMWEYDPDAGELEYETFWNNPYIEKSQFRMIREAGFHTVRIPVTWEDHLDRNGKISTIWMNRVQEVVDMALAEELFVIINTHHETWLNLDTAKQEEVSVKFVKLWQQIATRFRDYDEHLLFEGMNEPRLRDSEYEWGAGTEEMQKMTNRLNLEFVETVRMTGEKNRERYLLVCPYASNSLYEAMQALKVPRGNIIVSIHTYKPYEFCQDEAGTSNWSATKKEDTKEILEIFKNIDHLFIQRGIPVILTEIGCVDKGNEESRIRWIDFYRTQGDRIGVPCMWWDNGSDYELLDRENNQWRYPGMVEALVKENASK